MKQLRWFEGRLWSGMQLAAWLRLLARNRFAVSPRRIPMALAITVLATINTGLGWWQRARYGRRLRQVAVPDDPLFIIGHWRTGTTMLHELLALDHRNRCPTTYESLSPNHFLVSEPLARRWLRFVIPRKRPFDQVRLGFDRPQEDEVALCNLGAPSPFLTVAFPNRPPQYPEYVDLEQLSPRQLLRWQATMWKFLQSLLFRRPGRLVLKSPQHTFRVKTLLKMFPRARFVHIVRDPYVVFPSTVHFWKVMVTNYGLQHPRPDALPPQVFATFRAMYEKLEGTQSLIDPSRLFELRYEDLVADPVAQMRGLYERLELGDFSVVQRAVEDYAAGCKRYRTNEYALSDATREQITHQWKWFIEKYKYGHKADPVVSLP
jgi:omega-hydroxy-beta-dihydromenaquinone-9 sulfotransferase